MAYESNMAFVKIKDGVKAPNGFHYMPNGKLMSDADHVAIYGYIDKKIRNININTKDVSYLGEVKPFTITGDSGAIFSLEVYDADGNYFNFTTRTWSTAKSRLNKIELKNGTYSSSIAFNAGTKIHQFNIDLYAETVQNIKTEHANYVESRNPDDSINNNKSKGSNSYLLRKTIYQDVKKNLYLSCIAPSLYTASADTVNGATSSSNRIVIDGDATDQNIVRVGDKVTSTGIAAGVHALVTKVNPDNDNVNEIEISISDSASNDAAITFTPPFNGMTPHSTDSTTGRGSVEVSSGGNTQVSFSITCTALTGRTFSVIRTPSINDLCAFKTVTFGSAASAISDEDTSSGSLFFRWPVDNITGLHEGMALDPARTGTGANTTTPAKISKYLTTTTRTEVLEGKYYDDIKSVTIDNVRVGAIDTAGNSVTTIDRNGLATAQAGNIIFDKQQADALKADSGVRLFAYGTAGIKKLTGMNISLSDMVITPTQISTTTTSAVSASANIPLTEVGNISSAQTLRGIGINPSVAAPTVTSKPATSGGATIIASAAQTLEDGITLFFDGASNVVTITGTINIENMALSDTTLYFDVERFLNAV
tara:strand:+ start:808 stop:2589 length:1782 start_codon:yes stop_codon:yes gene_type:complete